MRLLVALFTASTLVQAAPFTETIDLNMPGAFESLAMRHPDHVATVEKILSIAKARPKAELAPWIEATFNVQDVQLAQFWLVSNPPKLKVAFTLDRTRYTANVVPDLEPVKLIPAR